MELQLSYAFEKIDLFLKILFLSHSKHETWFTLRRNVTLSFCVTRYAKLRRLYLKVEDLISN